jgi:cohesin loading factor subunit SCC2
LKILERSVRTGEDLDPFKPDKPPDTRASASPSKKSKVSKKPITDQQLQSQTLTGGDEPKADASTDPTEPPSVTNADLDNLAHSLELARDSILAADCCIALLGADRLPKQVYSEELITACLGAVKNQLDRIVYPFVESSDNSALLLHVSRHEKAHRAQIAEVFQVLASVLPRINNLVCADTVTMSDSIIIQGVYIAIGPFFVGEAGASDSKGKKESFVVNTLGQTAMRGLRLEALSLIRSVCFISVIDRAFISLRYSADIHHSWRTTFMDHWRDPQLLDQAFWFQAEGGTVSVWTVVMSMVQFFTFNLRLRDGRSIRTVSALLLQLVQTSAHGVRVQARRLSKARQHALAMRRQESMAETPLEKSPGPFLDEKDNEVLFPPINHRLSNA